MKLKNRFFQSLNYRQDPPSGKGLKPPGPLHLNIQPMCIYDIGLSLTIMLVMYTMYQSISESVTKTAYLKMIDYWLFFCLLMPFFIFMIEIYWTLQKKDKQTKQWISNDKKKVWKQQNCLVLVSYGLTSTFILGYVMIAVILCFRG